jgi:hypothetical protein
MSLWLRVRRAHVCVATIFALALALIPSNSLYLPLPNLLGGPQLAIPLAFLMPVAVGIVMAWGLDAGDPLIESVASRPLLLFDVVYALSAATLALAVCILARIFGGTDLALAAGRNALGYIGLTLLGRRILGGHAAAVLPASFAIAASLFGMGAGWQPRWWAWPIATADAPLAWGSAVVLLLLGAAVAVGRNDTVADR